MENKRKPLAITGMILALVLVLQNLGIININVPTPDNPTPPVVVPDVPDEPDPVIPVVPTPNRVLIEIDQEGFPTLPLDTAEVSLAIKESLLRCNSPEKALIVARVYADWGTIMRLAWTPTRLKTFGQFRESHANSIKGMLAKHQLTTVCTGLGPLMDTVIKSQIGEHGDGDVLSPEDYEKISIAFQAISARAYEAFQELVK